MDIRRQLRQNIEQRQVADETVTVKQTNTTREWLKLSLIERIEQTKMPIEYEDAAKRIQGYVRASEKAVETYQSRKKQVASDTDFTSSARTRFINEAREEAKIDIHNQAAKVQKEVDGLTSWLASPSVETTVSDVLLADASTRLHFMTRQTKYLSESSFLEFYENALADGDTAMAEWILNNFKSLVRQYTGKPAKNPERLHLLAMGSQSQKYIDALKVLDIAVNLKQMALYKLD